MKTNQPIWKCIANLGDVNPIEYGGEFVLVDETGIYNPEIAIIQPIESDSGDTEEWFSYRFQIPKCTLVDGILSDNKFHPECEAWFADKLNSVCESMGNDCATADKFCSDNVIVRAQAYLAVGYYFGFYEFDSYPDTIQSKSEAIRRFGKYFKHY